MCNFCHLHLHTEYSLLDGLIRPYQLVNKVKELGMDSVAMTDHGTMLGLYPFWTECQKAGVKPIIGCEVYVAPGSRFEKQNIRGQKSSYHMILLAENQEGYHNLVKLVSLGHTEGFYRKPRIDRELIEKYNKGLICTSACLASEVSTHLIGGNMDQAVKAAKYYQDVFGKDNYFIELQKNGVALQDKINPDLVKVAESIGAPLVATCDAHYLEEGDGKLQEVMWCISDGRKLDDETRRKSYGEEFYVKSPEEMEALFADYPEAVKNTVRIAERVENVNIKFDRIQPLFWGDLKGKTARETLVEQAYAGAKRKYPVFDDALKKRIDYELDIIHDKGYDDYFLIVGDLIRWARDRDIVVGVRGSAGGSVVAYCLDIINIEPIGWNCYFERFLNPQRPSPPDIDIDFQDDRRDEVIDYVQGKYGDGFCAIAALGRMKTKAAIKDVGRVMGIELSLVEKLSKMVHVKFGKVKEIEAMMQDDKEFAEIVNGDERLQELRKVVNKVEGMVRHVSTHACGHLITPKAITDYIPVQKETGSRDRVITQIEGAQLEDLGFMKFDFLGLRNLTIINNILRLVNKKRTPEEKITIDNIPLDDKDTFEKIFSTGKTTGVFQFESSGMKKYLKELQPSNLEDICFMAAAYRPGPMQFISGYIDCKFGRKKPEFLIPELEPIIGVTYGYAIYQEQVIKITVDIAGYTMGEADLLRRAMSKKKLDIMKQEEPKFKAGVMKLGYDQKIADQIWEYLLPFADYGFNKAHAAGYALVAYWTAYLKAHFPTEFVPGLIQSDINDIDRLAVDIDEANHMGITILPPSINDSEEHFKIVEGQDVPTIRYGLLGIKNFGENIAHAIIEERNANGPFKDFEDFLSRIEHKDLNKKSIEALAKAGALSEYCEVNTILENIDTILNFVKEIQKEKASKQDSLFGAMGGDVAKRKLILEQQEEAKKRQVLLWEKEYLGWYISGHPFRWIEQYFENISIPYDKLIEFEEANVKVVGQVSAIKKITTKKGDPMIFVKLENTKNFLEMVVFPRTYEETMDIWREDIPVCIEGTVNMNGGEVSLICNKVKEITRENIQKLAENFLNVEAREEKKFYHKKKDDTESKTAKKTVNINNTNVKLCLLKFKTVPQKEDLVAFKSVFEKYPGEYKIYLDIANKKIQTNTSISLNKDIEKELQKIVPGLSVRFS